jgi:hypothetical protein
MMNHSSQVFPARPRGGHGWLFTIVASLGWLLANPAVATELHTSNPYQVVAGYLHQFPKYVSWPPNAFPTNAVWRVGVLGPDPFNGVLEKILQGEDHAVAGRQFAIERALTAADLPLCHVVFIKFKEDDQIKTALAALAGQPVLTVGEADGFLKLGGMIQLQRWHQTIRMNINLDAARAANLKIPTSMLELAHQVVINGQTKVNHLGSQ